MTLRCRGQISGNLRARENTHRRILLASAATLLIFATLPTLAHHLPVRFAEPLPGAQHLWGLCLVAVGEMLDPVHHLFHLALAIGLGYGFWDRFTALRKMRSVLAYLDAKVPKENSDIWLAAITAGIDPSGVRVVDCLPNPAFTVGAFSPRIYVASDLGSRLSTEELAMVLSHEAAHVRRRDPLRLSVYRFLSCTFFWIPALRCLSDDIADEAEIEADDSAGTNAPLVLASAILRLADANVFPVAATVAFQNPNLLQRRIRRLAGEDTQLPSSLTRRSIAGACLSVMLVVASGLSAEQSPGGASHCRHSRSLPFAHLLCVGASWRHMESHCHHAT